MGIVRIIFSSSSPPFILTLLTPPSLCSFPSLPLLSPYLRTSQAKKKKQTKKVLRPLGTQVAVQQKPKESKPVASDKTIKEVATHIKTYTQPLVSHSFHTCTYVCPVSSCLVNCTLTDSTWKDCSMTKVSLVDVQYMHMLCLLVCVLCTTVSHPLLITSPPSPLTHPTPSSTP